MTIEIGENLLEAVDLLSFTIVISVIALSVAYVFRNYFNRRR